MSKSPLENAVAIATALKRKRAHVFPLASRARCAEVLISLTVKGILQEHNPPDQWSINPGMTKCKVQPERLVHALNDQLLWTNAKIRRHTQTPARTACANGIEGGYFSTFNFSFTKLLQSII